jgi:hypothetical protein
MIVGNPAKFFSHLKIWKIKMKSGILNFLVISKIRRPSRKTHIAAKTLWAWNSFKINNILWIKSWVMTRMLKYIKRLINQNYFHFKMKIIFKKKWILLWLLLDWFRNMMLVFVKASSSLKEFLSNLAKK